MRASGGNLVHGVDRVGRDLSGGGGGIAIISDSGPAAAREGSHACNKLHMSRDFVRSVDF